MTINFDDLDRLINLAENADIEALEVIDGDQRIHIVCRPAQSGLLSSKSSSSPSSCSSNSVIYPSAETAVLAKQGQDSISAQNDSMSAQIDSNENTDSTDLATEGLSDESDDTLGTTVEAPMMGTFYRRPEPNSDEFVHKGDTVSIGDSLCVIEAMKILHEVKAESGGVIKDILVAEGDVVEFGQPLFIIA